MEQFRNDCSEILEDQLFLSGYSVACNLEILEGRGITHISTITYII